MNIFRKIVDHGRGRRYYVGQELMQNFASLFVIDCLLKDYHPTLIVELGTGSGILTAHFCLYAALAAHPVKIFSYDSRTTPESLPVLRSRFGDLLHLGSDNFHDKEFVQSAADMINQADKPFLFIDGSDPKSKEINLYVPLLKPDIPVFAHDCNLPGRKPVRWGFNEDQVNWSFVNRFSYYYEFGIQGDTRLLCMKTKSPPTPISPQS